MRVRIGIKIVLICLVTLVGVITTSTFEGTQAGLLIVGLSFILVIIVLTASISFDVKEKLKAELKEKK